MWLVCIYIVCPCVHVLVWTQLAFLHSLNYRCLQHDAGDGLMRNTLKAKVLDLEEFTLQPETRRYASVCMCVYMRVSCAYSYIHTMFENPYARGLHPLSRRRYKFLSHLPSTSSVKLLFLDLAGVVSKKTLAHFQKEIAKMRKKIKHKAEDRKRADRAHQKRFVCVLLMCVCVCNGSTSVYVCF
jgi:hypothetical protein